MSMTRGSLFVPPPRDMSVPHAKRWYVAPGTTNVAAVALTLNRLYLSRPFNSGPDGCTIDQIGTTVTVAGSAGSICRAGFYSVRNQARPWAWDTSTAYADLLLDVGATAAGSLSTVAPTGVKTLTLTTPLAIAPNTWFCVAGINQVAAATRVVGYEGAATAWSPLGTVASPGYATSNAVLSLSVDSVSGALPSVFTPFSAQPYDGGIGINRSV